MPNGRGPLGSDAVGRRPDTLNPPKVQAVCTGKRHRRPGGLYRPPVSKRAHRAPGSRSRQSHLPWWARKDIDGGRTGSTQTGGTEDRWVGTASWSGGGAGLNAQSLRLEKKPEPSSAERLGASIRNRIGLGRPACGPPAGRLGSTQTERTRPRPGAVLAGKASLADEKSDRSSTDKDAWFQRTIANLEALM